MQPIYMVNHQFRFPPENVWIYHEPLTPKSSCVASVDDRASVCPIEVLQQCFHLCCSEAFRRPIDENCAFVKYPPAQLDIGGFKVYQMDVATALNRQTPQDIQQLRVDGLALTLVARQYRKVQLAIGPQAIAHRRTKQDRDGYPVVCRKERLQSAD